MEVELEVTGEPIAEVERVNMSSLNDILGGSALEVWRYAPADLFVLARFTLDGIKVKPVKAGSEAARLVEDALRDNIGPTEIMIGVLGLAVESYVALAVEDVNPARVKLTIDTGRSRVFAASVADALLNVVRGFPYVLGVAALSRFKLGSGTLAERLAVLEPALREIVKSGRLPNPLEILALREVGRAVREGYLKLMGFFEKFYNQSLPISNLERSAPLIRDPDARRFALAVARALDRLWWYFKSAVGERVKYLNGDYGDTGCEKLGPECAEDARFLARILLNMTREAGRMEWALKEELEEARSALERLRKKPLLLGGVGLARA